MKLVLQAAAALAALGEVPADDPLAGYRWEKRCLLIFAPAAGDTAFAAQLDLLRADEAGIVLRDLVVIADTMPEDSGPLRVRYQPEGFTVQLIGKDGGVKLRLSEPLPVGTLFATIDAMPMRQQEMRARGE